MAFPCSPALSKSVVAAASAIGATTHTGRVASGDRFVRDNFEKQRIIETFGAKCCEMEGAAIAQVAWANGVPCAIVRAISDKADGLLVHGLPHVRGAGSPQQCRARHRHA